MMFHCVYETPILIFKYSKGVFHKFIYLGFYVAFNTVQVIGPGETVIEHSHF